jgi:hypothetical protein
LTGLDSGNVTGDTTTNDDQVVITYSPGKRKSAIASGKQREPLRELSDTDINFDLPDSEAKPRFDWLIKIMGVAKLLGTALGPAWRRADRGIARGRTARNIMKEETKD